LVGWSYKTLKLKRYEKCVILLAKFWMLEKQINKILPDCMIVVVLAKLSLPVLACLLLLGFLGNSLCNLSGFSFETFSILLQD
jgi:hypothetical protein